MLTNNLELDSLATSRRSVVPQTRLRVADDIVDTALRRPVEEFMTRHGKRFRASIIELAYRIAGGVGRPPSHVVGAIEFLHAGSLVVDDVEDGTPRRRGLPAMHTEIGVPLAINAGNWMYFRALEMLARRAGPEYHPIIGEVLTTVRRCHEGQALDLAARVDKLPSHRIAAIARRISERKTGGLMGLSAWLGATYATASTQNCRAELRQFGNRLGVALQMLNDLGELSRKTPRLDDLFNRRVTWTWAWLAEIAPSDEFARLQSGLRQAERDQCYLALAKQLVAQTAEHGRRVINDALQTAWCDLRDAVGESSDMGDLRNLMARLGHSYE